MTDLLAISGLADPAMSAFWPSPHFMPPLNVRGGDPGIEAKRWAQYSTMLEERPDVLERARFRIAAARAAGVPMSINVKDPFVDGLGDDTVLGFLAAIKRKGPYFSAERCLEIAEKRLSLNDKKMAYLWGLRAVKTAQREKKPEIKKRAQELVDRIKAERVAQAAAGFGEDYAAMDVPFEGTGFLSQDVIQNTLTLHPVLQKMFDSDDLATRMLGHGIALMMAAQKVANERKQKAIARVAARLVKAARMAKLAKELGI